jgi:hypothetical protein
MAAPTVTHAYFVIVFNSVSSAAAATTGAIAAGNTIPVIVQQSQSTRRTINSVVDTRSNPYTLIGGATRAGEGHVDAYRSAQIPTGLQTGDTVTVNFAANAVGRIACIGLSDSTYGAVFGTASEVASGSHTCSTTGFATAGDVYMVGAGVVGGSISANTPGDGYAQASGDLSLPFMTKSSGSALTNQQAPYTVTPTTRTAVGILAAFYTAGGSTFIPAANRIISQAVNRAATY